ncbi:MAG: cupin domain-containing protein [Deltaproteobacteria bacterium]|nr:MAG: cupin domain-containing protein [Deltaproteobacteria bacterium]
MKSEEIILQTENVKVRVIELHPGEVGPWHFHSEITDTMFGVAGEVVVSMKNPVETVRLRPGDRCTVPPERRHSVGNGLANEPSKYLLVQGVGTYDFIREDN